MLITKGADDKCKHDTDVITTLTLLSEPPKSPSIPIKRYGLSCTLQQSHQVYGFDLLRMQLWASIGRRAAGTPRSGA